MLEIYVEQSACILLFLSKGYLLSRNCLREVRACEQKQKPRCLISESDPSHGGAPVQQLISQECPKDLRKVIDEKQVVQWHRVADFQLVSLKHIAEALLLASPAYAKKTALPLVMRGELLEFMLQLPDNTCLYTSGDNPGAADVVEELQSRYANLKITQNRTGFEAVHQLPALSNEGLGEPASHFLLYLSASSFAEAAGERFAEQVRAARAAKIPIILAHENDEAKQPCPFAHFFMTTPKDLVDSGLYKELAVSLMGGVHRDVSMALRKRCDKSNRPNNIVCHSLAELLAGLLLLGASRSFGLLLLGRVDCSLHRLPSVVAHPSCWQSRGSWARLGRRRKQSGRQSRRNPRSCGKPSAGCGWSNGEAFRMLSHSMPAPRGPPGPPGSKAIDGSKPVDAPRKWPLSAHSWTWSQWWLLPRLNERQS